MSKTPSKIPTIFFDNRGGGYWIDLTDRFLQLDSSDVKLHLRKAGLSKEATDSTGLNEVERALVKAQIDRHVDYAGHLAGHKAGSFEMTSGGRVLVVQGFRSPAPKKGDCRALLRFFDELLGDEQAGFALLWMKCALEALNSGSFRPGQLVVLAGPSGCGKSLFQALVTELLGGRAAKPYRYMIGETSFNSDLAAAEHWVIEDESASTDIRTRRKFGASLKEATVNRELSVHAKGRAAITLPTFRRVTLSVNDEPENLMILPPMDASIADKVTMFRCSRASVPEDRSKTWATFTGQLPALAAHLAAMPIAKGLRCPRFGVVAYHNEELMESLSSVAPETRLLNLIDEVVFKGGRVEHWCGTSEEMEKELRSSSFCFAVEKLMHFSAACGTYLGRLGARMPGRIDSKKSNGRTVWTVRAPKD